MCIRVKQASFFQAETKKIIPAKKFY